MYKNNEQRTGFYDTAGVPVLHGIKWKYEIDKGNPYISKLYKDILYFSAYIPYAIDIKNGKLIYETPFFPCCIYNNIVIGYEYSKKNPDRPFGAWNIDTGQKIWENKYINSHDLLIHKDTLYVVSRYGGGEDPDIYVIYLVNPMNGEILEEIELNVDIHGIAFWNDTMVLVASEGIFTIDFSKRISEKIKKIVPDEVPGGNTMPVINNNNLLVGWSGGYLYSINLLKNKLNWKMKLNQEAFCSSSQSPSVYDGIIYISNIDTLLFVDEKTGKVLKTIDQKEHIVVTPVAITKDEIYFASDDGILYALDRKTGKELWKIKLANRCMASPIISNGVIYIAAFDSMDSKGYVFAIY